MIFTKKNDVRLQRLETELLPISQQNMMISQHFSKVKSLFDKISKLNLENAFHRETNEKNYYSWSQVGV